jgi:hypothetical protein
MLLFEVLAGVEASGVGCRAAFALFLGPIPVFKIIYDANRSIL